jgi:hypothetical protein
VGLFLFCLFIYGIISHPNNIANLGIVGSLVFIIIGSSMVILLGVPPIASFIFLISPLRFRFYEEGIAINSYLVKKEHVLGYRKEEGKLILFIKTYNNMLGYLTTKVSMTTYNETDKLIPLFDKYGLSSNYTPESINYQKLSFNVFGAPALFPPK